MFELCNVKLPEQWPNGSSSSIGISNDGIITEISSSPLGEKYAIDCRGLLVIPGLIDVHVHDRDPSSNGAVEDRWSIQWAAARGGITTIASMANTDPSISTLDRYYAKVNHLPPIIEQHQWFGATPENWRLTRRLRDQRRCPGVKMATGSTTGDLLVDKRADQQLWLKAAADANILTAMHAELEATIRELLEKYPGARVRDHCVLRPSVAEIAQVEFSLDDAEAAGGQVHFCHISTPVAGRKIIARDRNKRLSFGVCPHHWLLNEEQLKGEQGGLFKMNPPLRTPDEVLGMQDILCDETLEMVTVETDHAPHAWDKKFLPGYSQVPSGVPSVEYLFPLVYSLVQRGKMSLKRLIDLTARNPARIFGFAGRKGEIAVGYDADLVVVDPNGVTIPRGQGSLTKCGWTAYEGMTFHGAVKLTIARGRVVYNNL